MDAIRLPGLDPEQLCRFLRFLPVALLALDEGDAITGASQVACRLLRRWEGELVGRPVGDFFPLLKLSGMGGDLPAREEALLLEGSRTACMVSVHSPGLPGFHRVLAFEMTGKGEKRSRKDFAVSTTFEDVIARSPRRKDAIHLAKKVAGSMSTVLLLGESGTGKEMFARSIHNHGLTRGGPFVVINCGAIPPSLVDSELFGYDEGAFTGARRSGYAGKFEFASGGTVFLDEIGEMPYEMQVKLLRLLQVRTLVRIGGQKIIPVNVRIIAATNRDLKEAVERREFRRDLYYRLNVFGIELPPLRECREDILPMAEYFLKRYNDRSGRGIKGFSQEVEEILEGYHWPGNARELENAVERGVLLSDTQRIEVQDLPGDLTARRDPVAGKGRPGFLKEREQEAVEEQLRLCGGNVQMAAQRLGISRKTLYKKIAEGGIDLKAYRGGEESGPQGRGG